ncbi:hypothetical protein GCM10009000_081830 [Halobacterium noricense]|uniref:Aminotransferase class V domain-containing protein n=1 Tax=Haladaptatus pallidirubidus TaxID=1008152 RepID=A0AAV3UPL0_9EURY
MTNWRADFGSFDGQVWLNCAHQGPLPKPAVNAIKEATALKQAPHRLSNQAFWDVPNRLKRMLGTLVNASPDEIVLGNSFSYGLHLLIRGLNWNVGDEVLLVEGDFPATILPWRLLEEQGVRLQFIDQDAAIELPQQISDAITAQTRVFCTT